MTIFAARRVLPPDLIAPAARSQMLRKFISPAARRVVPPDLIAPSAQSPIFRKLISPEERPPPDNFSPSPRNFEKLDPVPEPYLNRRASRTHKSTIPPSLTRSSETDWIKQACGCGCS